MRKLLLIFSLLFILSACKKSSPQYDGFYFGGVVINPNDRWVYLYQDDAVADSVLLHEDNTFLFRLKDKNPGLYRFVVKPEYQYVYFEPGDSLMIYLNTIEFDESLVFSGVGSDKNNFLINVFLENDKDADEIVSFYQLPTDEFVKNMDSLRRLKMSEFEKFKSTHEISTGFEKVAYASINFVNFRARELYPFINSSHVESSFINLPENYYDYRKEIDMEDTTVKPYYSYRSYLSSYLNNVSFFKCLEDCKGQSHVPKFSYHHNMHKLALMDSLITNSTIKDMLLQESAVSFLMNEEDSIYVNGFMNQFDKIIHDSTIKRDIDLLADNVLRIVKGKPIPDIWVVNTKGETTNLRKLLKGQQAVIYFWDASLRGHFRNAHEKINILKKQFPKIKFIAVSTSDNQQQWIQELTDNKLDFGTEFRALDFKKLSEDLVIKSIFKTFVIDGNGLIRDASLNLFDPAFEAYLQ